MFKSQKAPRDPETPDPVGSWREELKKNAGDRAPSTRVSRPTIDDEFDDASSELDEGIEGAVERIVARASSLGEADEAVASPSWLRVTEQASNHTDALRAALDAQQQAQNLLERATAERAQAAGQAEEILLEAQAMAARLTREAEKNAERRQREITAWASDQRRAGEELVAELREAAVAEAEELRVRAREDALAEAEAEAAGLLARVREEARTEADAIRDRARDALEQSSSLVAETQVAMHMFNESASSFMVGLQRRAASLEDLLETVSGDMQSVARTETPRVELDDEDVESEPEAAKGDDVEPVQDPEAGHDQS